MGVALFMLGVAIGTQSWGVAVLVAIACVMIKREELKDG